MYLGSFTTGFNKVSRGSWSILSRSTLFVLALLLLGTAGLGGCAWRSSQDNNQETAEMEIERTTFSFDQSQQPYTILNQYRLVPGDVLDVLYHMNTWSTTKAAFKIAVDYEVAVKFVNLPTMNETQVVRPDGTISLPYIGQVNVVGLTVEEMTRMLKARYGKIMRNPELYVVVPEYRKDIQEFKADLHTAPRGLSRLVTVRPDGFATFAMLGDIQVAGKSIPEISKALNEKYPKILPLLTVDLFLETHAGSNISLMGEVARPGTYPIQNFTSIIEALALAGGSTTRAKLNSIIVFRRHENKLIGRKVDVDKLLKFKKDGYAFYLMPDDIVYVPTRTVAKVADITQEAANALLFRGWSVGGTVNYDINNNNSNNNNNNSSQSTLPSKQ